MIVAGASRHESKDEKRDCGHDLNVRLQFNRYVFADASTGDSTIVVLNTKHDSPQKPFRLGAHDEIYRIKLVEKEGMRRYGFHNGHLAVGAIPTDRRSESSKYVHVYKPTELGLDATSTWIFEYCGDAYNPYDYHIKLYDPLDTKSILGGYLTLGALDGQDKRDDKSAYVHVYYPTNENLIARWMVIPTEDGNYQIVFKNERETIQNIDLSQKLVLCLHDIFGKPPPRNGFWGSRRQEAIVGRFDSRDEESAYAHVRIQDNHLECSTWNLEVTDWNAVLSAQNQKQETAAVEAAPSLEQAWDAVLKELEEGIGIKF